MKGDGATSGLCSGCEQICDYTNFEFHTHFRTYEIHNFEEDHASKSRSSRTEYLSMLIFKTYAFTVLLRFRGPLPQRMDVDT